MNVALVVWSIFLVWAGSAPAQTPPTSRRQTPRLLRFQTPVYPPIAWQSHIDGKVLMKIWVYKDGRFAFADEVQGPPLLVGAAKENIFSWVFAPTDSEDPIPLQVEYEYRIDKHRTTDQLNSEVTFELPGSVTVVAPEYSPACLCMKKKSKWRFLAR